MCGQMVTVTFDRHPLAVLHPQCVALRAAAAMTMAREPLPKRRPTEAVSSEGVEQYHLRWMRSAVVEMLPVSRETQ